MVVLLRSLRVGLWVKDR